MIADLFSKVSSIIINNIEIIIFYSLVAIWFLRNRKKFEIQSKIVALYRTKIGIKFIDRIATKYQGFIRVLGYCGIGFGFLGMIFILATTLFAVYQIFAMPDAPPAFAPALPGVKVPGSPIFIPFWYGIAALFVVTIIHEFAHGIVAKANSIEVKNTGIALFGPLFAAFVEPDETKLQEKEDVAQYSIFSAGPFSNIITAVLIILILGFVISPLMNSMVVADGFSFNGITPFGPAFNASVPSHTVFTNFNGVQIQSEEQLVDLIMDMKPGNMVVLDGENLHYEFKSGTHESIADRAVVGIFGGTSSNLLTIHKSDVLKNENLRLIFNLISILREFLFWVYTLSLGIGIVNLLPIGPVDGGRMLQLLLFDTMKSRKKALELWAKISLALFSLVLIAIFIPIIRSIVL